MEHIPVILFGEEKLLRPQDITKLIEALLVVVTYDSSESLADAQNAIDEAKLDELQARAT